MKYCTLSLKFSIFGDFNKFVRVKMCIYTKRIAVLLSNNAAPIGLFLSPKLRIITRKSIFIKSAQKVK